MSLVKSEYSLTKNYKQEAPTTTRFYLSQHPALVTMEVLPAPISCKLCSLLSAQRATVCLNTENKGNTKEKKKIYTTEHVLKDTSVQLSVSRCSI